MPTPEHPTTPPPGLRPVRDQDAPAVLDAFAAGTGPRDMARQGEVHDLASAREYVDWLRAEDREATALVDGGDRLIGLVAVTIDAAHRSGWFFYWLHPAHRGQGLMARAAAEVADPALRPIAAGGLGLERLELGHRADNPASGAVARAAGFVPEGVERGKFLLDGERVDVHTAGRLRSDPPPPRR